VLDIIAESIATVRQEADDAYERQKRMLLEDASVVFSPSWSPALQRVVLHRCLLDDWTSKTTLQALGTVAEPEALQQAIADLDYLILGRAIGALHDALPNSGKTILLVPVHYLTLNQKRSRDEYVALCHKVPPAYRKFLLLEIYGIPAQATAGRLLLVSQAVQNYFNALVLSLPIATSGSTLLELSANGVYGVSVSLDEVHPGESQALHRYLAATKSANLRCFLHAIKTTGQLKQAVDAGIDYVSGEAVAPKTDAPRAAYAWKPLDSLMPRG
jgi:hypothetical protein